MELDGSGDIVPPKKLKVKFQSLLDVPAHHN